MFKKKLNKNSYDFLLGIASGSYTVSISCPHYIFESVRVDINKNGNIRARKLDLVDTRKVILVKYRLNFESYTVPKYFEKREVFDIMDFISHPMFLSVVIPLILFLFVRNFMSHDLEMQQVMQQPNEMFQLQNNLPDLTDIFIRIFGGVRRQRPRND